MTATVAFNYHLPMAVMDVPHLGLYVLYCLNNSARCIEFALIFSAYCSLSYETGCISFFPLDPFMRLLYVFLVAISFLQAVAAILRPYVK